MAASKTSSSSGNATATVTAAAAIAAYAASPAMTAVAITDTSANIVRSLDLLAPLAKAGRIKSLTLSDSQAMTITYDQLNADSAVIALLPSGANLVVAAVTVAQAAAVQGNAKVKTFTLRDSAAAVATALDLLNADSKLTAVTLTDSAVLAITYTQFAADKTILGKLPSAAKYTVSAVTVAKAATVQAATAVTAFRITDTPANVAGAVSTLKAYTKLSAIAVAGSAADVTRTLATLATVTTLASIGLTDTTTLTVTYTQYQAYATTLARLLPADTMAVTGVTIAGLSAVAADPRVSKLTVSDTLAHIGAQLDTLEALAKAGRLGAIAVTDTAQTLTLGATQYAADQDAIRLMTGAFTIQQSAAASTPASAGKTTSGAINLVWDASALAAPAAFRTAIQSVASMFNQLIASPITVNIEVGYGDVRNTALDSGLIGETFVNTGLFTSFSQYKTDLIAHNTSTALTSALAALADPGDGRTIFVPGAQAKALGEMAPTATALDASIGFAADPTGTLYTYDPANRAVAGKYDLIGLAEHEIIHALGRVSYDWATTAFDLYRYAAPGLRVAANGTAAYASVDGGATSLGALSTTGDYADWASTLVPDAQNAFYTTGVMQPFSTADATILNALGYAFAADGTVNTATVSAYLSGQSSSPAFIPPTASGAATIVSATYDGAMDSVFDDAQDLTPPDPFGSDGQDQAWAGQGHGMTYAGPQDWSPAVLPMIHDCHQ